MLSERELLRFWPKVAKRGATECWPWLAGRTREGYGRFRREGQVSWQAHRVAWEAIKGDIPPGLHVWHACADRACCNPLHLYLATIGENNAEVASDGRSVRGEMHANNKLKEHQVLEIRARGAAGETQAAIARDLGVAEGTVSKIVRRKIWAWLEVA